MTDEFDLTRDLEKVQSDIPGMPNDFAILKSLIQTLPVPLPPEMRPAQSGVVNVTDPTKSLVNSALAGADIGATSGAVIGNISEIFYANSNLLRDPMMANVDSAGVNLLAGTVDWCHYWEGGYTLVSGTAPTNCEVIRGYGRGSNENPLNTAINTLTVTGPVGSACDMNMWVGTSYSWNPGIDYALPYLTASIKVSHLGDNVRAGTTKFRCRVEILDNLRTTIYAASPWFDLMAQAPYDFGIYRLTTAMAKTDVGEWYNDSYWFRMVVEWAGTNSGVGSNWHNLWFGEPALSLSATQAPPPFSPIVSSWVPSELANFAAGDTSARVRVGVDTYGAAGKGMIEFSDGTGYNPANLYRSAADVLKTDDDFIVGGGDLYLYDTNNRIARTANGRTVFATGNYTNEVAVQATSGYRCKIEGRVSTDTQSRWELWGDATWAGLMFGDGTNNLDTNLYRSAANVLKTDDDLVIGGGGLSILGSTQIDLYSVTSGVERGRITHDGQSLHIGNVTTGNVFVPAVSAGCDGSNPHLGFYGASMITKGTVTGSRGGNAALTDLLVKLTSLGLIANGTSA